jgi:hypothetical protein
MARLVVLHQTADGAGTTMDRCLSIPFEELVVYLREKSTIKHARGCLQRIHWMSTHIHDRSEAELALGATGINVRVFLASYLIAARPSHVFETPGAPLESALLDASKKVTAHLERICTAVLHAPSRSFATVSKEVTEGFGAALATFLARFKAWKVPDELRLGSRIRHALIALYQAFAALPADEPPDSALVREFLTQIERLRGKLQQIVGIEGLHQFDADRIAGRSLSPTTMTVDGGGGDGGYRGPYAVMTMVDALDGRNNTNEQLAHELLLDPLYQLDDSSYAPDAQPRHHAQQLPHPALRRIRDCFHKAFWDSIADDLRLGRPCFTRVLRVLREARDGLMELSASDNGGVRTAVQSSIDLPLLEQQMNHDAFAWNDRIELVGNIVASIVRIQSPCRDIETRAAWATAAAAMRAAATDESAQPVAFCEALRFLLDRVNVLRIDAANTRLRLIAPVIIDHGIEYERGKFQVKLNDGSLTLDRTRAAVADTVRRELQHHHDADGAFGIALRRGDGSAHVRVHTSMLLHLVSGVAPPPSSSASVVGGVGSAAAAPVLLPETLAFDSARLNSLFLEFARQALSIRLLLVSEHALFPHNQPRSPVLSALQSRIGAFLLGAPDHGAMPDGDALVRRLRLEAASVYASHDGDDGGGGDTEAVRALAEGFVKQATDCILTIGGGGGDAVTHFIHMRLTSVWRYLLFHEGHFPTRELAPELNLVHGPAAVLEPRIRQHAMRLMRLMVVNREIHAAHYNALVQEALAAV